MEYPRKMKLYKTFDYATRKHYWWTQRDKNTNCYEIRQNDKNRFALLINEIKAETFKSLNEAERRIKELWVE